MKKKEKKGKETKKVDKEVKRKKQPWNRIL